MAMAQPIPSDFWTPPPPVFDGVESAVHGRATSCLHALPAHAREARRSAKRAREFAAGRFCAAQALADAGASDRTVGVGRSREPLWPTAFVGSITHSSSFAWAAASAAARLRSIGIDSEPIFDSDAMRDAVPLALDAGERALVRGTCEAELATLVFSAKESLFKCLNPCIGVFFEFGDAKLEWLAYDHRNRGTFALRLLRDLATDFPRGRRFLGRHAIDRGHVHTAVELSP
jgi:enterobactin synthetase component D